MGKSAGTVIHALTLLTSPEVAETRPVNVITGDDGFLRHEARQALLKRAANDSLQDQDFAVEQLDGRTAQLRDVTDALSERSLFGGGGRTVVVADADALIKQYREPLETYVAKPHRESTLILEAQVWPANTRLAKAVAAAGLTIQCNAPKQGRELGQFNRQLREWLRCVAMQEFDARLATSAAEALLEQLPSEPGLLYQEVARLSLLAIDGEIDVDLVRQHVGGWRTRKTWDVIDDAADGDAAMALAQLNRLFAAGEEPHALFPQFASTLRRFSTAVAILEQAERQGRRMSLRTALEQAGIPKFKLGDAERQLRQIGRDRARALAPWLLAADLGLKGHNSARDRARATVEMLIIQLARRSVSI